METGGYAGGLYLVCGLLLVSAVKTFIVSRFVVRPTAVAAQSANLRGQS